MRAVSCAIKTYPIIPFTNLPGDIKFDQVWMERSTAQLAVPKNKHTVHLTCVRHA